MNVVIPVSLSWFLSSATKQNYAHYSPFLLRTETTWWSSQSQSSSRRQSTARSSSPQPLRASRETEEASSIFTLSKARSWLWHLQCFDLSRSSCPSFCGWLLGSVCLENDPQELPLIVEAFSFGICCRGFFHFPGSHSCLVGLWSIPV